MKIITPLWCHSIAANKSRVASLDPKPSGGFLILHLNLFIFYDWDEIEFDLTSKLIYWFKWWGQPCIVVKILDSFFEYNK